MLCKKCGNIEEFFIIMVRLVKIDAVGGLILNTDIDDERFPDKDEGPAVRCAKCDSVEVEMTNADVDTFWGFFNMSVDRRVRNRGIVSGG